VIRRRTGRRLATALFVDIVDSTRIATELGDRRWRELLGAFRRMVRAELKRYGGREEDTAGDGFFATFGEPAAGVQAAAAIVAGAQRLGVDVRCGLHSGELERIDSRLGGIAAHIAARVMATAGAAQVVVTATVRDLVTGGGFSFEAAGDAELKGVPGRWMLYRLTLVDGVALLAPLKPDAAADLRRRDRAVTALGVQRMRGVLVAGAVVAGLMVIVALWPRDVAPAQTPITMFRIDPEGHNILIEVRDDHVSLGQAEPVFAVDGALWQETPDRLVSRDIETGEATYAIDNPTQSVGTLFGFGSIWFVVDGATESGDKVALQRVDPVSGHTIATIVVADVGDVRDVTIGRDAIFVLRWNGELLEIDPRENAVVDQDKIPFESLPAGPLSSIGGQVWICDCGDIEHRTIVHWDPIADTSRRIEFQEVGVILGDSRESGQGVISDDPETVWLLDDSHGTLTSIDVTTGEDIQSVGVPPGDGFYAFGLDSIWMTRDAGVFRLSLETLSLEEIHPPNGVLPAGIGVDETRDTVWVSTWQCEFFCSSDSP
jgi:class 3 adenylate cyclase